MTKFETSLFLPVRGALKWLDGLSFIRGEINSLAISFISFVLDKQL